MIKKTALHASECDKEEYCLLLLLLLTLIQHSEASAPCNSHSVKIPGVKSQAASSRLPLPLQMTHE